MTDVRTKAERARERQALLKYRAEERRRTKAARPASYTRSLDGRERSMLTDILMAKDQAAMKPRLKQAGNRAARRRQLAWARSDAKPQIRAFAREQRLPVSPQTFARESRQDP